MAKKKEDVYPRNLYKKDGPEVLHSAGEAYKYSKVLVENDSDMKVALKEGYVDDFASIMSEEAPKEDNNFEDDDF